MGMVMAWPANAPGEGTDTRMATLALNSGLWVRRLLMGGGPFSGVVPRLKG